MKIDIEITYLGEDVNVSSGASQMVVAFEFYDGNFPSSSGGGAVDSVNGKTGTVVLGANDINESSTRFWLTDVLKSAYDGAVSGLSNKVDKVTGKGLSENDFTNALKSTYDGYASQISAKANVSEVAIVLFKSITETIITGKTAETSIYSIPLPNDGFNYMIRVYSQAQISTYAGSGNLNHRLRVGTYSSVIDGSVGADSIGQQTVIAINGLSSNNQFPITRNFKFVGGASGYIYGSSALQFTGNDSNSTTPFSLLTSKDFTTQHYLYVSFNPSNVGAIVTHNQILVTLIKI